MPDFNAIHVEDLGELAHVVGLVRLDLLDRQHGSRLGLAGGVADPRGEVADDQHRQVPCVLEGAELREDNRPPERHAAGGGINTELDPQLAPRRIGLIEALRERPLRQDVDGVT